MGVYAALVSGLELSGFAHGLGGSSALALVKMTAASASARGVLSQKPENNARRGDSRMASFAWETSQHG